ncbi:MAG: formylglycine-generating enzyme family protein [Treponema sp.]|nr:formylglycine-generating enzyme family protein [Treponema sp.]
MKIFLTGLFKTVLVISTILFITGCAQKIQTQMVFIRGGIFIMGSPHDEHDRDYDEMQREVRVSSFYMGKYEVTQREYQGIMRANPSFFKGEDLPVENISWYDAIEFCNRLSKQEGLTPAYVFDGENIGWNRNANGYRLPTEAEWEYACRAGSASPFNTGLNITTDQANYDGNYPYSDYSGGASRETTVNVGSFPPNSWDLFDMHGNVFEMCWDWYDVYKRDDSFDPAGPSLGSYRVMRGGSWINSAYVLRSSYRGICIPRAGNERIGFRLARNAQ